jgi:aarF domain-containing kinase
VCPQVDGVPIDDESVRALPQADRNRLAMALLRLCLREVFEFRLVQTDPNWSNFLYQHHSRRFVLLDFGATRPLSEEFASRYLELVWAAANEDREELIARSIELGFLTGQESQAMMDAHVEAGFIAGLPFRESRPFDFATEAGGPGGMTER